MNQQLLTKFDRERIKAARDIFEGIVEILEQKKENAIQEAFKDTNYASKSWSEYQADRLGTIRTLTETINLLKVKKDD